MNHNEKTKYNFNFRLPNYNPYYSSQNSNVGYGSSLINEGSWRPSNLRGGNTSHFSGKDAGSVDYNRYYGAHENFKGLGPKNFKHSDENIKEDVCHILYKNHDIDASEIEVNVKDGIVFLSGTVNVRSAKMKAEMILDDVFGLEDIQNNIKLKKWGNYSHSFFAKD